MELPALETVGPPSWRESELLRVCLAKRESYEMIARGLRYETYGRRFLEARSLLYHIGFDALQQSHGPRRCATASGARV